MRRGDDLLRHALRGTSSRGLLRPAHVTTGLPYASSAPGTRPVAPGQSLRPLTRPIGSGGPTRSSVAGGARLDRQSPGCNGPPPVIRSMVASEATRGPAGSRQDLDRPRAGANAERGTLSGSVDRDHVPTLGVTEARRVRGLARDRARIASREGRLPSPARA